MTYRTPRACLGVAVIAALALLGAACGSSKSGGGASGGATATTAITVALGTPKPASGAPLKIGYIYAGQTQTVDDRPELVMAQATVKYVNEYLGGVAGRPIQLVTCVDATTPAGATDCANQMLAAKVPVVLQSEPAQPASTLKVLQPAGVTYFNWEGADASVLTSTDSNVIGNPLVLLAAPIKLAQGTGVTKVDLVYTDVPAAASLKIIGAPLYKQNGMTLISTAVPLGTPDLTPQIQAALSSGAKGFLIAGDNSLCINTLKALKTLGFSGNTVSNMNCLASDAGKSVPGGMNGVYVAGIESPLPSDPDVALYHAIGAKYAPGTPATDDGLASAGYAIVMSFARAMKDLAPGDVTSAGVAAAFKAMSPQTMPLLAGQTFQCNRQASTLTPAVCSNGAALVQLTATGGVAKSITFDATPYLKG
jgi:branched-chain amino acid transport system substrate-binding protein